jgi:hypothetical protein
MPPGTTERDEPGVEACATCGRAFEVLRRQAAEILRAAVHRRLTPSLRRGVPANRFREGGSERDVRVVEGCDFLLRIYAPDGWFDHQELAGATIPLVLDTAHPDKRYPLEKRFRQKLKDRPGLRRGRAARGGADIRWPATGEGAHCGAVDRAVLQAKIKIAVRTLDPFLNDETRQDGENAMTDALGLLCRSDF